MQDKVFAPLYFSLEIKKKKLDEVSQQRDITSAIRTNACYVEQRGLLAKSVPFFPPRCLCFLTESSQVEAFTPTVHGKLHVLFC